MTPAAKIAAFLVVTGVGGLCQTGAPKPPPSAPAGSEAGASDATTSGQRAPADAGAAQRFPYPGEAKPVAKTPDQKQATDAGGETSTPTAQKTFPYPGDPDAETSSSSSSRSDAADVPPPETPTRRKLPREFHPQSPEDRVTEDIDVARFYRDKGDLRAAYLRAKDAVTTLPRDPEGHFLLGAIAQDMKQREEAVAELNKYLRLDPDGDHVKEARRRLSKIR